MKKLLTKVHWLCAVLLAATLLANGRLDWQGSNAMLPLALLLGGLLGGALTALRAGR